MKLEELVNPTYDDVLPFFRSLVPLLIKFQTFGWPCTHEYVLDGRPNIDALEKVFGPEVVPVDQDGQREEITFSQFAAKWAGGESIYLKDFHWQKSALLQGDKYATPNLFKDDWLNSFACAKTDDDFRFLYLGADGTRTSLHHDVYASNSWSVNLCGLKAWTLIPPDISHMLYDTKGDFVDQSEAESLIQADAIRERVINVSQNSGDILFVPCGWLHYVQNVGETLSLNHNFCNVYCLDTMFSFLSLQYEKAEHGLRDLRDTVSDDEFFRLVETITGANYGMTWLPFFQLILWHFTRKPEENGSLFRWSEANPTCRPPHQEELKLVQKTLRRWMMSGFRRYRDVDDLILKLVEMLDLDNML